MPTSRTSWKKYGTKCIECGKTEPEVKLTRHHVLTEDERKTGEIVVMCLECHCKEHENLAQSCAYESLTRQLGYYKSQFLRYRDIVHNKLPDRLIQVKKEDFDKVVCKARAYDSMMKGARTD